MVDDDDDDEAAAADGEDDEDDLEGLRYNGSIVEQSQKEYAVWKKRKKEKEEMVINQN